MTTLSNLSMTVLVALGLALLVAPKPEEQHMPTKILLATLIGVALITGSAKAQSIGIGNAAHGPDNQVIVGGKVAGKDADPGVRLEIFRSADRGGG